MTNPFDRDETRSAKTREARMLRDLRTILAIAKARAAALRRQLRAFDIRKLADLSDLQQFAPCARARAGDDPPYGGMNAARPGALRALFDEVGVGHARDWWSAARAMHAAGFVEHDVVLNCASYHYDCAGHMIHDAAERLRCAVYAAGPDDTDRQIAAIERFRATAYCGKLGVLRRIVERAAVTGRDISTLKKALVFGGPMSTHFRRECEGRGLRIRQAWVMPEIGVIAYETDAPDGRVNEGMIVNEGVHVEILDPETDGPARPGAVGEVVLTRPSVDFPVLRMRTGDLSRFIREPSPCGRSNIRIQGWMGRVEEMTTWRNVRVLPSHVLDMRARHACCRNMKLFVTGDREAAEIVLRVEGPKDDPQLPVNLRATMQNVLGFEAKIDICDLGALPRDGRLIVDERRAA